MPTSRVKYILCKIFSVWLVAGKGFLSIDSLHRISHSSWQPEIESLRMTIVTTQVFLNSLLFTTQLLRWNKSSPTYYSVTVVTLFNLDSWMLNVINRSIMNNFTTVPELSRTPENAQRQQHVFEASRTLPVLIAHFKKSPWRWRTSGNFSMA